MNIAVDGLNFNRDKQGMLNSLSLAVSDHSIEWPLIQGINKQMSSYSRANDHLLAQDIVMTMAEVAFLARYAPDPEDALQHVNSSRNAFNRRGRRTNLRGRRG